MSRSDRTVKPAAAGTSPPAATATASTARRATTLTVAGIVFLLLLDGAILNTSLPRMAVDLGVPPLTLSAAVTGYLLAGAATTPLSPWLAERWGGRRVCLAALLGFTLASGVCGLSTSLLQLVAARVLQGASGGLMFAVGRILVLRRAGKAELMSVTALLVWPALMAPVVGPPLGGFITTYLSWRWNFLMNLPLGAVAVFAVLRFVPPDDPAERRARPFDRLGALLTATGLGVMLAGLEASARAAAGSAEREWALAGIAAGVALLAWDFRHLRRAAHPLISLAPFRVRTFAVSTLAAGTFSGMCIQATPYLLPLMFQLGFGLSAVAAGSLLLPYFLGNLAMKTVTTRLLRRHGFRRVLIADGVLAMFALGACGLLARDTPYPLLVGLLVVAGASRSLLFTALSTLALADIDLPERGAASTLQAVSNQLGVAFGVALSTALLALFQSRHGGALVERDFEFAFFALAVVGLASVAGYLRIDRDAGAEVSGRRVPATADGRSVRPG